MTAFKRFLRRSTHKVRRGVRKGTRGISHSKFLKGFGKGVTKLSKTALSTTNKLISSVGNTASFLSNPMVLIAGGGAAILLVTAMR